MIDAGTVRSIDLVLEEQAKREGDGIHQWAKAQDNLVVLLTEEIQQAVREALAAHPPSHWCRQPTERR
jgi:Na+(H+)/acetate symporter ActP